jgi:hypothetical protein
MDFLNLKEIVYNNITFDIKQNIKTIYTTNNICENTNTNEKNIEYYDTSINNEDLKIFFLFETEYHNAFGHWIYENATFLPFIKYFPKNMYILVNENEYRTYKKLFFNLFNINEDKLYYLNNTIDQELDYNLIPENNICIVCRNLKLNTQIKNEKFTNIFTYLTDNFCHEIFSNNKFDYTKKINHLFFPRNKKENYTPNNRCVDYSNLYEILKEKEYVTYNTLETIDIKDQIQLLLSADNVYLEWGSSFFVNGLFCRDSNLYTYGNVMTDKDKDIFFEKYSLTKKISNIIKRNNDIISI